MDWMNSGMHLKFAQRQIDIQTNKYRKFLEHRIEINDVLHGSKRPLKKGIVEGTIKHRVYRDRPPKAIAVRVNNTQAFVYNLKHKTATKPVPIGMALATVRLINEQ